MNTSIPTTGDGSPRDPARRRLIAAWVSVGLIPVGAIAGMLIGTFLLSALTPGGVEPESATVAQVVSAAVPALIVTVLAPVAAIVWGTAAVRAGRRAGFAPLVLGAAAGAYLLLANLAPLLLGALSAL